MNTKALGQKDGLEFGCITSAGDLFAAFVLASDALNYRDRYRVIDPGATCILMTTGQPFATVAEAYALRTSRAISG